MVEANGVLNNTRHPSNRKLTHKVIVFLSWKLRLAISLITFYLMKKTEFTAESSNEI